MSEDGWRVAIDRGGTFTDIVATSPEGTVVVRKVPSAGPGAEHRATLDAVRAIVEGRVSRVRYGTTAATNALLTRRGEPSVLFVTAGFGDLLRIGTQERPDLFALHVERPAPLPAEVVEVEERVLADGTVQAPLERGALRAAAEACVADGFRSAAVVLLHAYAFPAHELEAGRILAEAGFEHVALSHQVACEVKAVERGTTASAEAFLTPVLRRSFGSFRAAFARDVDVRFMQSHGGLADLDHARGTAAILSGPAGGVVAVGDVARRASEAQVIGFDMGGTSTDVCRFAGSLDQRPVTEAAGMRLQVPSLRVVTVAAGGGSVLSFDGRRLLVGPESAGSDPGPAGYGWGGPATITDANAVLGRVAPDFFPNCFGKNRDTPFDERASFTALEPLAGAAGLSVHEAAQGFLDVANERMAQAIREVSVARGYDVREHALVCFGGAAAQHACALAAELGVPRVLIPPYASVLSAWGIGLALPTAERAAAVLAHGDEKGFAATGSVRDALESAARDELTSQGVAQIDQDVERFVDLRYAGVDETVTVVLTEPDETLRRFHGKHERLYGFARPRDGVEIVTVRVRVTARPGGEGDAEDEGTQASRWIEPQEAYFQQDVWMRQSGSLARRQVPIHELETLWATTAVRGPALLVDDVTTVVVEPGWWVIRENTGMLSLEREAEHEGPVAADLEDPVALTLFANRFMAVAERMGRVLERVSHSTNIKERLDFSCAVFDGEGRLVANAPHIPVHLGAMGASVRAIAAARGRDFHDGDVVLTNDPYHGGSHLPDVTAVTPVLVRDGVPAFWVANRAHHADVGGTTPGSMPAESRTLEEEGVVLHDVLLIRDGQFHEAELRAALGAGRYPARAPDERLADLRAQAAANAEGARLLTELAEGHGADVVGAFMAKVLDDGEAAMGELIASLPFERADDQDALDDGTPLRVQLSRAGGKLIVDFEGTGPESPGNFNAPPAVVRAAVLYALRTLLPRPIPLNEGCLRPVEIRIPDGSLLSPRPPAAVVGGNVETSMRIVDLVLAALGACAASHGTMNNVAFGLSADSDDPSRSAYYETIGGGTGAGPAFDGASAVQAHMTNTRITDPEVLERRWPVVVRRFAVRYGSGGAGAHRGGDGIVRELEFLEAAEVSVLSGRRARGAPGLAGGDDGTPGRNVVLMGDEEQVLPGAASLSLPAGAVLRVETPGGGGFGAAPPEKPRNGPTER